MVALDAQARVVTLEDNTSLPYEALVLCTGLQDQTRARLGIAPHDQVGERVRNALDDDPGLGLRLGLPSFVSLPEPTETNELCWYGVGLGLGLGLRNYVSSQASYVEPARHVHSQLLT